MPAPSSKDRKDAVSRTPVTVKKVGFVNKRRPGHSGDNRRRELLSRPDPSLRREK